MATEKSTTERLADAFDSAAERAGAGEMKRLLLELAAKSNADVEGTLDDNDVGDVREYRALAAMVRTSIDEHLNHDDPAHAQGYLRALTDLLCITADECVSVGNWDPLANTATAYLAPELLRSTLHRMKSTPNDA